MVRSPLPATLAVLLLAAAACGSVPEPVTASGSEMVARGTGSASGSFIPDPNVADPSIDEFVPRAPANYVAEIMVASDDAVLVGSADDLRPVDGPFGPLSAIRAVDDLLGGIVLQQRGSQPDALGDVVWYPADSLEPVLIDGAGARLLDVGYIEGSPFAVVERGPGDVQRVRLVDLDPSSLVSLPPEEQLLSLSASGGLHAVAVADEQCGQIRFYTAEGEQLDLAGPGMPVCVVPRRAAYGAVALSPDGSKLAYTLVTYRDDGTEAATEVAVRDLVTGVDLVRRPIGSDAERITALSFDGDRIVYLRESATSPGVRVVPLASQGADSLLSVPDQAAVQSVAFARLATGG